MRPSLLPWFLALFGGLIFTLAFYQFTFVILFAFVFLFCALLLACTREQLVLLPVLFSLTWFVGGLFWIANYQFEIFVYGLLYTLSFYALWGFLLVLFWSRLPLALLAPLSYILLFFFFSFLPLGNFLFAFGVFSSVAAVPLWVWQPILLSVQALLAFIFVHKKGSYLLLALALLLFVVALPGIFSFFAAETSSSFTVSVVHPNLSQSWQWRQTHVDETFSLYAQLTQQSPADLVLWPEYALVADLHQRPDLVRQLEQLSRETKSTLILGALDGSFDTAYVVTPTDGLSWQYRSRKPFPFDTQVPSSTDDNWYLSSFGSFRIALCYEELFSSFFVPDADFFIVLANNQRLPDARAAWITSRISRMHALASGKPVIRVANRGISEIIAGDGRVVASLPADVPGVLRATVRFKK
jgi:apolipoprotein N-acyltransferase